MLFIHLFDILSFIDSIFFEKPIYIYIKSFPSKPLKTSKSIKKSIENPSNSLLNNPINLDFLFISPLLSFSSKTFIKNFNTSNNQFFLVVYYHWAWIWKYISNKDLQTIYFIKSGKVEWRYNYYKIRYFESNKTCIISAHLQTIYQIIDISG